jgi:amino acid transporter
MSTPSALVAERYRLVKLLGAGGMGVVWHAWDERLHRPVALKMLRTQPELSDTERQVATDRAMREARINAGLHHPHAVTVFDVVAFSGGAREYGAALEPLDPTTFFAGNVGFALAFAVALFTGFESTAIYREETVRPSKTIPRAGVIVVLIIGVFYALTSWAFIAGLGESNAVTRSAENPAGVFFEVANRFGGQWLSDVASVLLISSVFAAHLAIQNVSTRYVYSLAVDGILPKALGKPHPRFKSPARASVTVSLTYFVATGLLIILGLTALEIYAWFAGLASFTLILAMVLVYVRRAGTEELL